MSKTKKIDLIKLPFASNKRKKLSQAQKEHIREVYKLGNVSQRELASMYDVSRRTIVFCIYPGRYEHAKAIRRKAWEDGKYREYYNKEKHRLAIKSIRERKRRVKEL